MIGIEGPCWRVACGILLGLFLIRKGDRAFEILCKILVLFIGACFLAPLYGKALHIGIR